MQDIKTLQDAKEFLAPYDMTISKTAYDEYRVNFKDGHEATAYYTDCLNDAVATGILEHNRAKQYTC